MESHKKMLRKVSLTTLKLTSRLIQYLQYFKFVNNKKITLNKQK